MSLKGLRFTLEVDGQRDTPLAVTDFLEKKAVLTIWQGMETESARRKRQPAAGYAAVLIKQHHKSVKQGSKAKQKSGNKEE
ncbi:hypothetical protein [Superficieibacter sp.]|uniref:hypothetical protein n=1 Tax=Superficieibacter sp. TaxID=2303322 RepID=UPI0028AFE3B6|nr:hypothetical protein [Superficieibacter sp.]